MGSSLDVIGPLTRSVEDAALVLDCMAGKDDLDSTTIDRDKKPYSSMEDLDLRGKKFGLVKEYFEGGLDAGVRKNLEQAIEKIKKAGGEVSEVSLPSLPLSLAVYYIICPAEVSSNLSRYDGQRYGFSDSSATNLNESYSQSRSIGFGDEAKRRIMIGTYVLSSGYYDAYYQKAQLVRTKIINEFAEAFKEVDFLLGPTTPTTAFKLGANTGDPLKMYMSDVLTVGVNLAGIPAISIPSGLSDGLPVGLQIMAPSKKDRQLLQISKEMEKIQK